MYPRLLDLGPLTIYTYGILLAAAYLLGLKLAMTRAKARQLDEARILDLGIYIIVSALIGASCCCSSPISGRISPILASCSRSFG